MDDRLQEALRALKDALPGIHSWFSEDELIKAVSDVASVVCGPQGF